MSGTTRGPATFYRPAEVAAMLRCSEWWIKEQARQRRIPYSWIGGSYLFTEEHVVEIVRLFEVRPTDIGERAGVVRMPRRSVETEQPDGVMRLQPRTPRRARNAAA